MAYNAQNQVTRANIHGSIRIGKIINSAEVVQYVVDKNRPYAQVLEEQHTHGGLSATMSYVYGDALISAKNEGRTYYYHTDGLSSVRHLAMPPAR